MNEWVIFHVPFKFVIYVFLHSRTSSLLFMTIIVLPSHGCVHTHYRTMTIKYEFLYEWHPILLLSDRIVCIQAYGGIKWILKLNWITCSKPALTKAEYLEEVSYIEDELKDCQDEVAFCHNDCWWSNQIYNKDKGNHRNKSQNCNIDIVVILKYKNS